MSHLERIMGSSILSEYIIAHSVMIKFQRNNQRIINIVHWFAVMTKSLTLCNKHMIEKAKQLLWW